MLGSKRFSKPSKNPMWVLLTLISLGVPTISIAETAVCTNFEHIESANIRHLADLISEHSMYEIHVNSEVTDRIDYDRIMIYIQPPLEPIVQACINRAEENSRVRTHSQ